MIVLKRLATAILCIVALSVTASAHPGRTDSDGGHNDNINGGYHYHHGHSAHEHINGECPYDERKKEAEEKESPCVSIIATGTTVLMLVAVVGKKKRSF
mgnify:CR=1 FL=1